MDVTAPKSSHVIDSIAAASKGGEKSDGSSELAITFSNVLKASSGMFKAGSKNDALDSIISRNSGQSDAPEADMAPAQDDTPDDIQHAAHDDGYDDDAMNDRGNERDSRDAPAQYDDTHQNHADAPRDDVAPRAEATDEAQPEAAAPVSEQTVADTSETGAGEQSQAPVEASAAQVDPALASGEGPAVTPGPAVNPHAQAHDGTGQAAAAPVVAAAASQDNAGAKPTDVAQQVAAPQARQQGKAEAKTAEVASTQNTDANAPQLARETQGNAAKTQAQAQTRGQNTHVQAQAQPITGGEAEAAKQAQSNAKAQQSATPTQQQAQDLSKRLEPGQRMDVNVTVDDKSSQLTSRPSASLAQASGKASTSAGQQGHNAQGQQGPAANATPQAMAAANIQAQIQAQGAAQAQTAAQPAAATAGAQAASQGVTAATSVDGASSSNAANQAANAPQSSFAQQAQAAAKKEPARPQTPHQRAAVDQVSVQITKAMKAGADTIRIQMKPAALGRVDVHLEVSDGRVTATVFADNKETLEMLQRGSRDLARALNSAGLSADNDNLSFNLREQGGQQQQANDSARSNASAKGADPAGIDPAPVADLAQNQGIIADGRIDIHA